MQNSMLRFGIYEAICGWLYSLGKIGRVFYTKPKICPTVPTRKGSVEIKGSGSGWGVEGTSCF
jgi:hypothetical protein